MIKKKKSNAGRKPIDPKLKKVTIRTQVEQYLVDGVGGEEKAKDIAYTAIKETENANKLKSN